MRMLLMEINAKWGCRRCFGADRSRLKTMGNSLYHISLSSNHFQLLLSFFNSIKQQKSPDGPQLRQEIFVYKILFPVHTTSVTQANAVRRAVKEEFL